MSGDIIQKESKKQQGGGQSSRKKNRNQIFIIIGIIFVINSIINDFINGFKYKNWGGVFTSVILWGAVFIIFWKLRGKFLKKRMEIKEKFEKSKDDLKLTDASLYSLAWFKEIYTNIPQDRKKIVNMSFLLISCALIFLFMKFGELSYILSAAVVILSAIGLLIWTVTEEREERNRLQDELKVAREMQLSLMPKENPDFNGYDIHGICIPAKEVGGDIFDYALLGKDELAVSVMDVSGKGLDAALSTVFMSGAYSSEIRNTKSAVEILNNLNETLITHRIKGKFVTFLLTIFNSNDNKLHYVNAGQQKPILKRSDEITSLNSNGSRFALGMVANIEYSESTVDLLPGDLFVLYTDGVTEAMNRHKELYTMERMEKLLAIIETDKLKSDEISQLILDDVKRFVGEAEQHDDIAMVIIKVSQNIIN